MVDDSHIYELEFPSPSIEHTDGTGPVLLHGLEGFADAGHAVSIVTNHLRESLETELIASFAVDELIDYRSRRPPMTFVSDHFSSYDKPELSLYAVKDLQGTPFLLLAGMEPDFKWEKFTAAVQVLAERFGVSQSVGLSAIPMAVPHTRPLGVIGHASEPGKVPASDRLGTEVQVPGSASALLELRMGQNGFDARGFSVHVPHYLSQSPYPAAALRLLASVTEVTGISVPLQALEESARTIAGQVDEQLAGNEEAAAVVHALENQYDLTHRGDAAPSLLESGQELPSGDELGAEFERFLAEQATGNEEDKPGGTGIDPGAE
ncbi:proteasome assembly chaperone family protein [Lolliginicoccus levis]|uniref:proteasome assembly chaperone family protein n=1 Tax=Lolliginicoccus levis TaxID=2919542 RepID=UPI00241C7C08|nr:PAC2 family protein [Lolliginicoccus levis]